MKASRLGDMFVYTAAALCLLPLVVMVGASLFYGGGLSGEQYGRALLQTTEFFQGFWRSFLYTAGILAINIPVSLLTAYGFTRRHFRGRQVALWLYIVLMLMPFQALIVPQYLALKALGLLGLPWAVVLPNAFSTLGTFLMVQYMRSLDGALFEAGKIDGAGEWQLFLRLAAPLCRPVAYALLVLCFVNYWSMVEQPIVFLKDLADMSVSDNGERLAVF